jgi:hypothetical protein
MNNFIEKTDIYADLKSMKTELLFITEKIGWPKKLDAHGKTLSSNQIGLNHRPGADNQFLDNVGSLMAQTIAKETDFTEYNDMIGETTKQALENLSKIEGVKFGRIRYMLLPEKTGLTVHTDTEIRYHYVLETNPNAFFGERVEDTELAAKCYHIPADGYFYRVDTTRPHFVYNGSREPRIHLVICSI